MQILKKVDSWEGREGSQACKMGRRKEGDGVKGRENNERS